MGERTVRSRIDYLVKEIYALSDELLELQLWRLHARLMTALENAQDQINNESFYAQVRAEESKNSGGS